MLSNYPPGHPTGTTLEMSSFGYVICEHCLLTQERKREIEPLPQCPSCNRFMEVLLCDQCENEAEYEVYERDVNAASHFCKEHVR
jgi:hypothetical protein